MAEVSLVATFVFKEEDEQKAQVRISISLALLNVFKQQMDYKTVQNQSLYRCRLDTP
jgi:polyisoprenoid-binding protein YceI